jgi:hypothetical protein
MEKTIRFLRTLCKVSAILNTAFATMAVAQSGRRAEITGLWSGWHQCGAMKVGTSAMISVDQGGHVIGIRQFYPTPGDPDRASGSFRISGTYQASTGTVSLIATDWINQPSGYLKCDLIGQVDQATKTIVGASSPACDGCGRFELTRQ